MSDYDRCGLRAVTGSCTWLGRAKKSDVSIVVKCHACRVESLLKNLVWPFVRSLLPLPDLVRRLRVRRAAMRLVALEAWPSDDATTGPDVAQLAMLRLLWLQRETRSLTRGRHREAAVLMSRSALETCILGLYCLLAEDPVSKLRESALKSGLGVFSALLDGMVPEDILKDAIATLGVANKSITDNVKDMAAFIDRKLGESGASKLYSLVYAPISNYFSHANAGSLIRHVSSDDTLRMHPLNAWVRRSPVRVADSCVGILAVHLARYEGQSAERFSKYAEAHLRRILPPLTSLVGKRMGKAGLLHLARTLIRARKLRPLLAQPQLTDEEREALARELFRELPPQLGDLPEPIVARIVDHFVQVIVRDYANIGSKTT